MSSSGNSINTETIISLDHENNQLKKHWRGVSTTQLIGFLKHIEDNVTLNRHDLVNHYVRQFHGVLGYKAMGGLMDGGLCAGALYRSKDFVSIGQPDRCGSKAGGRQNVHIEHTVPVSVLVSEIFARYRMWGFMQQPNARDEPDWEIWAKSSLYDFLQTYSVTTALTLQQGHSAPRGIIRRGLTRKVDTPLELNGNPFTRYVDVAYIVSVSGGTGPGFAEGQCVAMDQYTFECHRKRLVSLMNDVNQTDLLPRNWPQ